MVTTYIDRDNTNEEVYRRANAAVEEGTNTRAITKFSTAYQKQKLKQLQQIINSDHNDPIKQVTLDPNTLRHIEF
jgi:hypothetical protein